MENTPFEQYCSPEELNNLLTSTINVRPELAQFVDGKCVHNGTFTQSSIDKLTLRLHYEIN